MFTPQVLRRQAPFTGEIDGIYRSWRRHALEQYLKEAMLEFEVRKQHFNMAKASGAVPEEKLRALAFRVDSAVNTAWDITQLIGSPAH